MSGTPNLLNTEDIGNAVSAISLLLNPPEGMNGEVLCVGFIEKLDLDDARDVATVLASVCCAMIRDAADESECGPVELLQGIAADLHAAVFQ